MKNLRHLAAAFATLALALTSATAAARAQAAKPIKVEYERCVIVVPDKRNEVVKYAVDELRDHIKLVSGIELPVAKKAEKGKCPIYVGLKPDTDTKPFADEEARWNLSKDKGIYLYGKDKVGGKKGSIKTYKDAALSNATQAGTLFAVYEFLEAIVGVRWVEPGANGTAYVPSKDFVFTPNAGSYIPQLTQRSMRVAYKADLLTRARNEGAVPADLRFTDAEYQQRLDEELTWRRRMRMGSVTTFSYGHSFTKWWEQYGKSNPEYFALNKNGKRAPISSGGADRIKMCVSNPRLVKQVVDNWFAVHKPGDGGVINACENDSRAFCTCEKCKALDVVLPGEEDLAIDDRHLSDRYVHFTNAVLREARKIDPAIRVVFYAYSRYNFPPRREKLDDGVVLFLLPNTAMSDEETEKYYQDWKAAGAKVAYLRPNDLNQDNGFPLGFEEQFHRRLQVANKYLALRGVDFDTCFGFWPSSGIANYILARGFYRPDIPFAAWEMEYCSTFGPAAPDMLAYYRHWRGVWNQRIMGNLDLINKYTGNYKLLRSKITQLTHLIYDEADFDKTEGYLKTALAKKLLPAEKARIENLLLQSQHTRLKYRAVCANRLASPAPEPEQRAAAQALYDFRKQHRLDLNYHWELLSWVENRSTDDSVGQKRLLNSDEDRLIKWRADMTQIIADNLPPDAKPLR